jgi:SPP1 family predicted phage head-tail adaptor
VTKLGDLYNYITFERYILSDSDYGDNDTYSWSTYASCFAEIIPESESEIIANNQIVNRNIVSWRVRYDSNITENMRIYFDSNYYDITGIKVEGRNKFLILKSHKWSS